MRKNLWAAIFVIVGIALLNAFCYAGSARMRASPRPVIAATSDVTMSVATSNDHYALSGHEAIDAIFIAPGANALIQPDVGTTFITAAARQSTDTGNYFNSGVMTASTSMYDHLNAAISVYLRSRIANTMREHAARVCTTGGGTSTI